MGATQFLVYAISLSIVPYLCARLRNAADDAAAASAPFSAAALSSMRPSQEPVDADPSIMDRRWSARRLWDFCAHNFREMTVVYYALELLNFCVFIAGRAGPSASPRYPSLLHRLCRIGFQFPAASAETTFLPLQLVLLMNLRHSISIAEVCDAKRHLTTCTNAKQCNQNVHLACN